MPHLLEFHFEKTSDIKKALLATAKEIHGTFALAVIFKDHENTIAVAKRGSPLILGLGKNENFIASDYYAIADHVSKIISLEDDEFAILSPKKLKFLMPKVRR